jgi:ribosomal protein L37E
MRVQEPSSPPERRPSKRFCNRCAGLAHRRDEPVCKKCGMPYAPEVFVVHQLSKKTNWDRV